MNVLRFRIPGARWITFIILILRSLLSSGQPGAAFILPVDTPIRLAGTFGELRSGHFHTGVDFRTGGVEGKAVCASGDGWVSRVKISTVGFGVVVYVDHPSGHTTVYAHLHHLLGPLADYIDSSQQAVQHYEVELFPDSGRFKVLAGEVIALSGNSGGSEGPHLHFEIREREQQIPLNPLAFLYLKDTIAPSISELIVFKEKGDLYDQLEELSLKRAGKQQELVIPSGPMPDTVTFAARMDDSDDPNILGIYEASLTADGNLVFSFAFDSLHFDDGRYVNAHSISQRAKSRFHRLHRLPGNKSGSFKTRGPGVILLKDTLPVFCRLIAGDYAGNTDTLDFILRSQPESRLPEKDTTGGAPEFNFPFKYDTRHVITADRDSARLEVPAGACYQDFFLALKNDQSLHSDFSEVIRLKLKDDIPFHKPAILSLPLVADKIINLDRKKIVVSRWDDQGRRREVLKPDTIFKEALKLKIRLQGRYLAEIDTMPPQVVSWSQKFDPVDGNLYEVVHLSDKISGVASAKVELNGNWMKSIFDPRDNTLKWKTIEPELKPAQYFLTIEDGVGNLQSVSLYY